MDYSNFDSHGRIKCGTVTTPVFEASLADYRDLLRLDVVEEGQLDAALAASWGTPASAGKRYALVQPQSGAPGFIRIVEGSAVPDYVPLRSYGWASLEITVEDVWKLHEEILAHGVFDVIGPPKLVDGFDSFIPMQVVARGGEVLYLNKVNSSTPETELPHAHSWVDHIFITILAAPDREASVAFYRDQIGFDEADTYELRYSVINAAFGLPEDTKSKITMTQVGLLPGNEIDDYPAGTIQRPRARGELPPGVAMVSYIVDDLGAIKAPFIAPPQVRDGPLYAGRRVATVLGAAGELLELIEGKGA